MSIKQFIVADIEQIDELTQTHSPLDHIDL